MGLVHLDRELFALHVGFGETHMDVSYLYLTALWVIG